MLHPGVAPEDDELDAVAWGFINSPYATSQFADWPIDRRLDAYLDHGGLSSVADDGTLCEALLDRVMAKIPFALDCGTPRPDGSGSLADVVAHIEEHGATA